MRQSKKSFSEWITLKGSADGRFVNLQDFIEYRRILWETNHIKQRITFTIRILIVITILKHTKTYILITLC